MIEALIITLLTIGGMGYNEIMYALGTKGANKLVTLAKKIYNKIADNQELLDKLTDAYNRRDNQYMTELMQGAGFGPRTASIKEAMKIAKEQFQAKKAEHVKENARLSNLYNQANQAMSGAGTMAGNINIDDTVASIEQQINGGANNVQEQKK